MQAISLADLLGGMNQDDDKDDKPKILPEAAVMRLREVADAYAKPCPFKVGDLVTVRPGTAVKGAGEPHVVVEVLDTPITVMNPRHYGSAGWGAKIDLRVLCFSNNDDASAYWVESWYMEPYTLPVAAVDG